MTGRRFLTIAVAPFVLTAAFGRLGDNMTSAAAIVWFLVLYLPVGVFVRFAGPSPVDD